MSKNKSQIINIPNFTSKELVEEQNIINGEDEDTFQLTNNTNNYDINKQTNNNFQIQTELKIINNSSLSLNESTEIDKNKEKMLEQPTTNSEHQSNFSDSLLYGNSINDLTPKRLGKLYAFFYINNKPLIIIGPDCKKIFFILYIFIIR